MTVPKPKRSQAKQSTPVRASLNPKSTLLPVVKDGLDGLESKDKNYIDPILRLQFADSLALDESMKPGREQDHRWDYLLGHAPTKKVIGLEPHSAKDDEVSAVIAKRKAALDQLRPHLKDGIVIQEWFWVASSKIQFANTEKTRIRLDQAGIRFVDRQLLPKHLEEAPARKRK